ncbi:MAG: TlyA family RNA methyltransferase [Alphaproteobacteria bacterium]|nr:TlyA family RNA methyltransferase [Alphaproteobacteria bacterium]
MGKKVRLDRWVVERGLAPSRQRARELIEEGRVLVGGIAVTKAAAQVDVDRGVMLKSEEHEWVGRGARKLLGALEQLPAEVEGRVCADLGSSTGGFTEVLLHRGAARVYAVDVGKGLLHERLRDDPRVVVMEGVNARHLDTVGEPLDLLVGDLSFISLRLILPAVARLLRPEGEAVILVKPQFEVGREHVGGGGKVRDDAARADAIARVRTDAEAQGFTVLGAADSAVPGARSGNVEHFLWLRRGSDPSPILQAESGDLSAS